MDLIGDQPPSEHFSEALLEIISSIDLEKQDLNQKGSAMERFEYSITTHANDNFMQVTYFCSEQGDCSVQEIPREEPEFLVEILNEYGLDGWELVQLVFGKDGLMACWKRKIPVATT